MNLRSVLQRPVAQLKSWFGASGEGQWRGPFSGLGELGSFLPMDRYEDGWQRNLIVPSGIMQYIPAVAGAIHLHRSAGAQLRPEVNHYDDIGNVSKGKGAASRVLINPNSYETGSEFQARAFSYVVHHGMACIVGFRNLRFEVEQIHIVEPNCWQLYIEPESREPFVLINQDGVLSKIEDATIMVPMRDVFIFKWGSSKRNPLLGESPLEAAGIAGAIYTALSKSQTAFFSNMRRPSGVLVTEEKLTRDQMRQLREAFNEQSKSMQSGGIPILANGLKWEPMSITSQDAEVIASIKMSNEEIARAVGVPPPLLGQLDNATLSNVEQLISHWMSISLGGLVERFERGLDRLFGLNSVTDRIEMDTTALLRTDFAERMQSYGRAIQGGVMTPNEVRRKEGLSPVQGGDDVFLQRQMTSVGLLEQLNANELAQSEQIPQEPVPEEEDVETEEDDEEKRIMQETIKRIVHAQMTSEMHEDEVNERITGLDIRLGALEESQKQQSDKQDKSIEVLSIVSESIQELKSQLSMPAPEPETYDDETTSIIVRDAITRAMSEPEK